MKILITGGAGFIGSHACDLYLSRGDEVVAVDDLSLGVKGNLAHIASDRFRFIEMDVRDQTRLTNLFSDCSFDRVIHLAANSDIARSHADPTVDFERTMATTFAVLEAMRLSGTRQLVFASSSAIYGEADVPLTEGHGPLLPASHYGAAKLASEAFISSYVRNYGLTAWIARFPNVVGERATHGAIYDFVRKLRSSTTTLEVLGNGEQIKPYLHVSDVLSAISTAVERMSEDVNLFNIAGADRCTVRRMAEIVIDESGLPARIEYTGGDRGWTGDVPRVDLAVDRLLAAGWAPTMTAEDAVRRTARWLWAQPC